MKVKVLLWCAVWIVLIVQTSCGGRRRRSRTGTVSTIQTCSAIVFISPLDVVVTSNTVGGVATYTCGPGYELYGISQRTCQADGTWSGTQPTCLIPSCPAFTPTDNLYVQYREGINLNTEAVFECNQGYRLSDNATATCIANGTWNNSVPTCERISCGLPPTVQNGSIVPLNETTLYEDLALIICTTGFYAMRMLECLANQTWDSEETFCQPVPCTNLNPPETGSLAVTTSPLYQDIVTFACQVGFEHVGESYLICNASGQWDYYTTDCRIGECDLLDAPLNGWLNFIATTNGIRWIGTVARFGCNVGYRLTNTSTSTRTCSSEFTWTGSSPNCVVDNTVTSPKPSRIFIMPCICNKNNTFANMTQDEIIAYLIRETQIQANQTARNIYKLACRSDPRASSAYIGLVTSVAMGSFFLLIFLSDIPKIYMHLKAALSGERLYRK